LIRQQIFVKLRRVDVSKGEILLHVLCRVRVLLLLPVFHPRRNFYTVIIAIRKARADSSFNGRITEGSAKWELATSDARIRTKRRYFE